jgi:hypothetical protein
MKAVEDPTLAADLALLATLDVPFEGGSKTFVNATAEEILAAVRASCRAQIEADRRVFGDSGGWELARLDCNASTPRQALDAVAAALTDVTRSVGIDVAAGLVVFTDMIESATRLAAVRHYDLRPVLLRRDLTGFARVIDDDQVIYVPTDAPTSARPAPNSAGPQTSAAPPATPDTSADPQPAPGPALSPVAPPAQLAAEATPAAPTVTV